MMKVTMVKPKLLDRVPNAARVRHLSYRTEQGYKDWIRSWNRLLAHYRLL